MKKVGLLILFIIITVSNFAQSGGEIKGTVKDVTTGETVVGASVMVAEGKVAITDINGNETVESISFVNNAFRHFIFGAELFPDKNFNIRLGYNFRKSNEFSLLNTRSFAGLTAGFGLKMNKIKLNYAFSKYHPVSNTHTFSLNLYLNKFFSGNWILAFAAHSKQY